MHYCQLFRIWNYWNSRGSEADGIQSVIGNVAAGSVFAICTSLGMTGVFASSTSVGAILETGGLAAYLGNKFNPENDDRLIKATIENNDNQNIIINILHSRTSDQIDKIRVRYEELY